MRSSLGLLAAALLLAACSSKSTGAGETDGAADVQAAGGAGGNGGGGGDAGEHGDALADVAAEVAADGEAGAADPFTRAVQSFCQQKAAKICAREAACSYGPVSEATCRAKTEADCIAEMDVGPARSAAAGRLTIDEAAVARCLAAYDLRSCSGSYYSVPLQCSRLFKGKIADGQPCLNKHECAGGICNRADTCPGTCASYGAIGADCGLSGAAACDPATSFCDKSIGKCSAPTPGGFCWNFGSNECVAGETCLSSRNAPCGSDASDRITCHCAPLSALGSSCTISQHCQPGLVCAGNTCRAPSKLGEPCDLGANVYCQPGLACIPAVTDGGDGLAGTCGPRVPEGSKCVTECQAGLACVPDDVDAGGAGTCRPLAKVGQACSPYLSCVDGARCDDAGKCVVLPLCADNPSGLCAGGRPAGANCGTSPECASFICGRQTCLPACSVADL